MILLKNLNLDKILALNASSLFAIYCVNFSVSLIILPKLISIFGISEWGKITFVQIFLNYFIWLIDWSFPQYSCKLISINEKNPEIQQAIFTKTRTSQFILFSLSSFFVFLISIFFRVYSNVCLISILTLFGNFLQPYWYFNGREKVYETALFQLLNKTIFTLFIFLPIIYPNKMYFYFIFYGFASLLTGILCNLRLKYYYNLDLKFGNIYDSCIHIKKSSSLFISSIIGTITTSILPISISYFYGTRELGIYNIADRIKNISIQAINPLSHSIFPRMSKYYYKDKSFGNKKFILLITFLLIICSVIYACLNIFIDNIVIYFTNENFQEIKKLLEILLVSFIINVFYETFINQYLIVNNLFKEINKVKLIILFSCITLGIPLIYSKGIYGAAITNLLYEIIGLFYVINVFINTKNKQIINKS